MSKHCMLIFNENYFTYLPVQIILALYLHKILKENMILSTNNLH